MAGVVGIVGEWSAVAVQGRDRQARPALTWQVLGWQGWVGQGKADPGRLDLRALGIRRGAMTTKTGSGAEGGSRPPPKDKPKPQSKRCACCGKSKARLYGGVCKPCLFG